MGNCAKKTDLQTTNFKVIKSFKPFQAIRVSSKPNQNILHQQKTNNIEQQISKKKLGINYGQGLTQYKNSSTKGTENLSGTILEFYGGSNIEDLRQSDGRLDLLRNPQEVSMRALPPKSVRHELQTRKMKIQSQFHIKQDLSNDDPMSPYCKSQCPNNIIIDFIEFLEKPTKEELDFLSTKEFQQKVKAVQFYQGQPGDKYSFKKKIGDGGNCKVYLAENRTNTNDVYAVRYMSGKKQSFRSRVKKQIAVMNICQSEYILRHHFTYSFNQKIYMFVEYMNAGSLFKFIQDHKPSICDQIIGYILKQVLKGLTEVHKRHQIHRDIKSQNILLNSQGQIKIGDFGAVAQLTKQMTEGKGFEGTVLWMAPEIMKKQPYSQKIDIWSLGIVTIQLCTGTAPHQNLPYPMILRKIVDQDAPKVNGKSRKIKDFVNHCLQKNPQKRWSCEQLLKHPFIQQLGPQERHKQSLKAILKNKRPLRK